MHPDVDRALDDRLEARLEVGRALREGLRLGLVTRMTNRFLTMSTGSAATSAQQNFINGVKLAIQSYEDGMNIIDDCLEHDDA
jgi:hypothetical protein